MKRNTASLLLLSTLVLAIAGCSSSNNDAPVDPSTVPVTGEFHIIQPADVPEYISNFEAQRGRVMLTLDGSQHQLALEGFDQDENALYARFDNQLLVIGFDFEKEEPLPVVQIIELDANENIIRQRGSDNLDVAGLPNDDVVYSGTLKDAMGDSEYDINLVINESLISGGTSTIEVTGAEAVLNGDLGTATYIQIRDLINTNPQVNRLLLQESSGSVNDAINIHTGRLVRAANLATHVPADGDINSGAVDLFAAGVTRTVEDGANVGVHSWCCEDGVTADKLLRNDEAHGPQLTYFREMLPESGVDFYFFTLDSAPFDGIHSMTREELLRFNLVTE